MNRTKRGTFDELYQDFNNPLGRIMSIAHRAMWAQGPENSLLAIRHAISTGIDMVEIDVRRTKDGQFILMHDDTVERMTGGQGKISDLNLSVIRKLRLKQAQGGESAPLTDERIPTLEEVLALIKGKIFINLDKCWLYRDEIYKLLMQKGTLQQALFKSTADLNEVSAFLNSKSVRPEYMHMMEKSNAAQLNHPSELYECIQPKAIELLFDSESHPFVSDKVLGFFTGKCRIWMTTMWDFYCGGHSDQKSLKNPEEGWGWCIGKGANMIQTDYPQSLVEYLNRND